jgi:hypothetical protein
MTEITLADYTGYIFTEIISAREMADRHSRALAEVYAKDPVLQFFSVPRFRVPKMELTIPVLISGARFQQVISFRMDRDKFLAYVNGRILEVVSQLHGDRPNPFTNPEVTKIINRKTARPAPAAPSQIELATQFYEALGQNPDPSQPANIVRRYWTGIFEQALARQRLLEVYKKTNPNNELLNDSLADVLQVVVNNTVVDSTTLQSLLINPETNIVKDGSTDTTVFTLKAELLEEGFFIRQIRDEETTETHPVVEFD